MLYEYENELSPTGPDPDRFLIHDCESMSTEEIEQEWKKQVSYLKELRKREPSKKRKKLDKYRIWVSQTHSCIREINYLYDELQKKKVQNPAEDK